MQNQDKLLNCPTDFMCPEWAPCDSKTNKCTPLDCPSDFMCPEDTKCDIKSDKCIPLIGCNKDTKCLIGTSCNKMTGNCDLIPTPHKTGGFGCINNPSLCYDGTKCDNQLQKCVPDICTNQHSFEKAVYKALKYSVKKEDRKLEKRIAIPLLIYMIIHLMFLVWAVMIAMKQPEEKRVLHLTLAIVFSPVYVLANYLN